MASLKKNNLILNLALLCAILLSWWLVEYISATTFKVSKPHPKQVSAFMTDAHYQAYNSQGQLQTTLYSSRVNHYPYQNASTFVNPHIIHTIHNKMPWEITAKHGQSLKGINTIHLTGNVNAVQSAGPHNPKTTLKTNALTYYPHQQVATTNLLVTLIQPDTRLETTGATLNLKTNQVALLSNAHGQTLASSTPETRD